jgi:phosphatidate cytidylyltransferase
MALNIKTLGTRALTALVFVVVLLGSLLWNYYSFTIFFFIVALMGLNEFYKLSEKLNAKPYKSIGFMLGALVYCSFVHVSEQFPPMYLMMLAVLVVSFFIILSVALFTKRENPIQNSFFTYAGILYSVIPFGMLHLLVIDSSSDYVFSPQTLFGIIILIWSNDTFAYLGGSLIGKHKMIERISPGKTWEGTIVGVVLTVVLGYLIGKNFFEDQITHWILLGICVPILATLGDLVESMLKRQAGIKDTGNLMPGHGGILDRFDSLIFVAPFVYVLLKLL